MVDTTEVIYIAGPMTGIPQFNFPAFDAVAEGLRSQDYTVVSPAEMDDPQTRKAALASPDGAPGSGTTDGQTWGDFLARDVKLIADEIDVVAVIPGWEKSRGARLETFVARALCGKRVVYAGSLRKVPKIVLAKAWLGPWFKIIFATVGVR
jgi:Domain of unknown function (DUF4406)